MPTFPLYIFRGRTLSYETWQNARSLQLTGHMPTDRLRAYGRAFHLVDTIHDQMDAAGRSAPALNTLAVNAGRISPAERDRLFVALGTEQYQVDALNQTSLRFLQAARAVGVELSAADKARILTSMSDPSMAGPCVKDPTPRIERDTRGVDWFLNPKTVR